MVYDKRKNGSVVTFYDKEICIKGEYLKIATVSEGGNIQWFVDSKALPEGVFYDVCETADVARQSFRAEFEQLPADEQFHRALAVCPAGVYLQLYEDSRYTETERLKILKDIYFSKV